MFKGSYSYRNRLSIVKRPPYESDRQFSSKKELWEAILVVFEAITSQEIRNLRLLRLVEIIRKMEIISLNNIFFYLFDQAHNNLFLMSFL